MRKWHSFSSSSWFLLLIVCVTLSQLVTWLEPVADLIIYPGCWLTLTPGPWQRSSSSVCGSPITLSQSLNLSKQLKSPLFIDPEWTSRVAGQYYPTQHSLDNRYKENIKSTFFPRDIIALTKSLQCLLEDLCIPIMFLEHHGANDPHKLSLWR